MKTEFNPRNYPELMMGTRADGSPLVIEACFKGSVRVADGQIYVDEERFCYDVAEARERLEGLQDAVRWIEGDLSLAVEKFHAEREGQISTKPLPEDQPRRIGVTRTRPMRLDQQRPSTPMWVTWRPRGEDDPRPWIVGDSEPESPDLRRSSESVIELTDVPSMTVNYTNIPEVIDFMGAPGDVEGCRVSHDNHGACVYTREWGEVWLGQGTTVWKLDTGRCYIQHGSSPTLMFVWPPVEVLL